MQRLPLEQQVARLQSTLVRQLSELGAAAARNVQTELQGVLLSGLPAAASSSQGSPFSKQA